MSPGSKLRRFGGILFLPLLITCTQITPTLFEEKKAEEIIPYAAASSSIMISRSALPATSANVDKTVITIDEYEDPGLTLYRNRATTAKVAEFYTELTGSTMISEPILRYAEKYNVPLSLAFSLAWVESGFSVKAVNVNHTSVDRGLFQLNSRSFPELQEADFFDPEINTRHGLWYLSRCLEQGGNEITGLAMYNAGRNRVENGGTPLMTLAYISKILEYQEIIEGEFNQKILVTGIVINSQKRSIPAL